MNKKSLILMATYNGEKYIQQQLESIKRQTYKNWKLIIRDDGSIDGTEQILTHYASVDNRIVVFSNRTNNHGAYLNFWTLINLAKEEYSDFDYYFFSDQDDVWENDKLEIMISEAEKAESSKPLLLYSDMQIIDSNNRIIHKSINNVMGIGEMKGLSLFFTHGFLWGCAICVNSLLFNTIPPLPLNYPYIDIMSHDNYMGKYALISGSIQYIDRPLINHRRHGYNATGSYLTKLNLINTFKRMVIQSNSLAMTHARVYNQTLVFIKMMKKTDINFQIDKINEIEDAIHYGGIKMFWTMLRFGVRRKQSLRTIGIYITALFGTYKRYLLYL